MVRNASEVVFGFVHCHGLLLGWGAEVGLFNARSASVPMGWWYNYLDSRVASWVWVGVMMDLEFQFFSYDLQENTFLILVMDLNILRSNVNGLNGPYKRAVVLDLLHRKNINSINSGISF